ncbi:ACT domain-containing protein [Nymphaea thermarum]|nr:ACT domain-containing protein [Nymphaea thermarum]
MYFIILGVLLVELRVLPICFLGSRLGVLLAEFRATDSHSPSTLVELGIQDLGEACECSLLTVFLLLPGNLSVFPLGGRRATSCEFSDGEIGLPCDDVVLIRLALKAGEPAVITVNCPNKTGLGCDLCWIILEFGLSINRGVKKWKRKESICGTAGRVVALGDLKWVACAGVSVPETKLGIGCWGWFITLRGQQFCPQGERGTLLALDAIRKMCVPPNPCPSSSTVNSEVRPFVHWTPPVPFQEHGSRTD